MVSEMRTGAHPYDITYEYDQGGNRKKKIESTGGCNRIETVYHYDVDDPATYGSFNNRLMKYQTYESCRVFEDFGYEGSCGTEELVSTTWYYYNSSGNVTNVVAEKADPYSAPLYEGTRLEYARNGRAVTYVLGETWGNEPYNITYAREFRYDGARQRYMNRELDPNALESGTLQALSTVWSDYDGDGVYGDFTSDGQTQTDVRSFDLGFGKFDWTAGQLVLASELIERDAQARWLGQVRIEYAHDEPAAILGGFRTKPEGDGERVWPSAGPRIEWSRVDVRPVVLRFRASDNVHGTDRELSRVLHEVGSVEREVGHAAVRLSDHPELFLSRVHLWR